MKKVLAAIDGSQHSAKTLQLAAKIAGGCKANLAVAYVAVPLAYSSELDSEIVAKAHQQEQRWVERVFQEAVTAARQAGVNAETVLLSGGPPAETIAEYADRKQFDLVVIGRHGREAVSSLRLGRVADHLVHLCRKPILVAR